MELNGKAVDQTMSDRDFVEMLIEQGKPVGIGFTRHADCDCIERCEAKRRKEKLQREGKADTGQEVC